LSSVYIQLHDLPSAASILPEAIEVERQTAVNPQTLAASIQLLGQLRAEQRNWSAAEALYREAAEAIGVNVPVDEYRSSVLMDGYHWTGINPDGYASSFSVRERG